MAVHSWADMRSSTEVLQQKILDIGGLVLEHLFHEVVQNMAMAIGERLQQARHIVTAAQRMREKLEAGSPSLGALLDCRDPGCRQLGLRCTSQEFQGLFVVNCRSP